MLKTLGLSNNKFTDTGVASIAAGLTCVCANSRLRFQPKYFTACVLDSLYSTNTSLRELNMHLNSIGDDGATALASCLWFVCQSCTYVYLYFSPSPKNTYFYFPTSRKKCSPFRYLFYFFLVKFYRGVMISDNKTLQALHLKENRIGCTGAGALGRALWYARFITVVRTYQSPNTFSRGVFIYIRFSSLHSFVIFSDFLSSFIFLCVPLFSVLSFCGACHPSHVPLFSFYFSRNKTLQILVLDGNQIGDDGAVLIGAGLAYVCSNLTLFLCCVLFVGLSLCVRVFLY